MTPTPPDPAPEPTPDPSASPETPGSARRRPRRTRTVTESLLSIVLVLDAVLVFFVMLTVYGLRALEPVPAFAGGLALIVVLLGAALVLRYPWGIWIGWVLQAVLVATGVLLPAMYVVAAIFVAMWVYCVIRGGQIDRQAKLSDRP